MPGDARPAPMAPQIQRVQSTGGSQYNDPMACYHCYVKHLSKASVEASEVCESDGREHEMSLCLGNIACAEDHAEALGLSTEKEILRRMRDRIWVFDRTVSKELLEMSVKGIVELRRLEAREADRKRAEEAERKAKEEAERNAKEEAGKAELPPAG